MGDGLWVKGGRGMGERVKGGRVMGEGGRDKKRSAGALLFGLVCKIFAH